MDREKTFFAVKESIIRNISELEKLDTGELKEKRYNKYRTMGVYNINR